MIKKYIAPQFKKLTLYVNVEENQTRKVRFEFNYEVYASIAEVEDEKIQKAMESMDSYGTLFKEYAEKGNVAFKAEEKKEEEIPVKEEKGNASDPSSITSFIDARSWMLANVEGCLPGDVKSKASLLQYATSKGISFPNLR